MSDDPVSLFDSPPGDSPDGGEENPRGTKKRTHRAFWWSLSILLVLVLGLGGVLTYYLRSVDSALSHAPRANILPTETGTDAPKANTSDALNIVLMGSDSRGTDRGRSDSLIVLHLSGDRQHAYLVSFPRDMWVSIPGYGKAKINAAYSWGGPTLTIRTLESLTGIQMDHAVITDFTGFTDIVDAIGGIDVYNDQDFTSRGTHFPIGTLHLDGADTLKFTRERYSLKNGDLDRARNQRNVLKAILQKIATPQVLANPTKFNEVASKLTPYLTFDSGLTNAAIWKLAASMRLTSVNQVRSLQVPLAGFGTSSDGQDYDVYDVKGLAELSNALANDTMEQYYQAHINDPGIVPR